MSQSSRSRSSTFPDRASAWLVGLALLAGFVASAPLSLAGPDSPAAPATKPMALEEATAKTVELEETLKAHLKDKDLDSLKLDVKPVLATYLATDDADLRSRLSSLLVQVLHSTSKDEVEKPAIEAIGKTGDPALYKYIKQYLSQPNTKEIPELLPVAIEAAGNLKNDDAVGPLLTIVTKSKRHEASVKAMQALANFREAKRVRGKIVTELTDTVSKDQPGRGKRWDNSSGNPYPTGDTRTGDDGQNRWAALSGPMVEALNKLTGQNVGSPTDWFELVSRYKSRLNDLFSD